MPLVKIENTSTIAHVEISESGIAKLLRDVDPSKASGPDNIPNRVLKECADSLAPALTLIFQRSVDTGTLPNVWLKANVSSVFKKGKKDLAENYRPISLTSVISKLLEHVICKAILCHLENNDILTNLNHGFRSGYSCETQLLVTSHDLLKSQDKGIQVDMAILDFSKAFDTVPHNKLLHKLDKYGIKGPLHAWLKNFLTKRYMRVVLEGTSSNEVPVVSGVPQGTVLGPLLFLCHINDLPDRVKSQIRLFADDCLLYREIKTHHDHTILQDDLKSMETWAEDWGMRFNTKKCYILSIKNKSSHPYTLNQSILERVQSIPYLGVILSDDLKWKNHIDKITNKASQVIGFLKRNLSHSPISCKRNAYLALVRSTVEYGAMIWDPYLQEDINKLERVQRQGVRFITGNYTSRTTGCVTQMLNEQKLVSLKDRRKNTKLVFMCKIVRGLIPAIPSEEFFTPQRPKRKIRTRKYNDHITHNIVENYVTNNSECFVLPNSRTQNYRHSFFVQTIIDWNHLDESSISAPTVEAFRNRVACHHH